MPHREKENRDQGQVHQEGEGERPIAERTENYERRGRGTCSLFHFFIPLHYCHGVRLDN